MSDDGKKAAPLILWILANFVALAVFRANFVELVGLNVFGAIFYSAITGKGF